MNQQQLTDMALFMRRKILEVSHACNLSTHLGGGLSIVEITATLYGAVMNYDKNNPAWEGRDRFILSKGHGVLGYYSALLAAGIISEEQFSTFQTNGSDLIAHPVMNLALGIESSNGSLGQGLSLATGMALAAKKSGRTHRTYVLLGDGECNEGAIWEAVMSAAQQRLDNLVAVVDYNKLQSDGESARIIDLGDLGAKFDCFGWEVKEVDGHAIPALYEALVEPQTAGKPRVVIAHTTKGKGISFMENNNDWHHNRLSKSHYDRAIEELGVQ